MDRRAIERYGSKAAAAELTGVKASKIRELVFDWGGEKVIFSIGEDNYEITFAVLKQHYEKKRQVKSKSIRLTLDTERNGVYVWNVIGSSLNVYTITLNSNDNTVNCDCMDQIIGKQMIPKHKCCHCYAAIREFYQLKREVSA